jgi:hypothetical protein
MASRWLRWRRDKYGHQDRSELAWEDAVWQYFLDHARPTSRGTLVFVMPELKSKEDLVKRIKARKQGKYRYTEREVWSHRKLQMKKPTLRRLLRRFLNWVITKI